MKSLWVSVKKLNKEFKALLKDMKSRSEILKMRIKLLYCQKAYKEKSSYNWMIIQETTFISNHQ